MKRLLVLFAFAFVLTAGALPARAASPFLAPIYAWAGAVNAGDRAAMIALFARDATIVDDFSPYYFSSSAPARWYDGFLRDAKANRIVPGRIVVHAPKFVHSTATAAWVVAPTDYPYTLNGKRALETGSLVFTLVRTKGEWKISSMSWAALTDSPLQ
jgi:ketosteroid isomerase-like protein